MYCHRENKTHFERFEVLAICHTDNGSQFISEQYKKFSVDYGFKHTTSSPYHPKGNGRAEGAVKVAVSMLKKAEDFNSAILIYRNNPPQGHTYSPAQHNYVLTTHSNHITHHRSALSAPAMIDVNTVKAGVIKKRQDSKAYYDKSGDRELIPIKMGSFAYAKPPPLNHGNPWIYGKERKTTKSPTLYALHMALRFEGTAKTCSATTYPPPPAHTQPSFEWYNI